MQHKMCVSHELKIEQMFFRMKDEPMKAVLDKRE